MTAFATWYIHFDICMYVYDVIFFLIGSSSMEKHPVIDVVTVCQWFIDRWGYRKQDKWALPMLDVCYPFAGTHTTSALFSELYLQVGSKSSTGNMRQWYQKETIFRSATVTVYITQIYPVIPIWRIKLYTTVTVGWNKHLSYQLYITLTC